MNIRRQLTNSHSKLARATGQLALCIERGKIRRDVLQEVVRLAREAAVQIEEAQEYVRDAGTAGD